MHCGQDLEFGRKYLSRSVSHDIREMTAQIGWSKDQMATFKISVKGWDAGGADPKSQWVFHLVTDAYPCRETPWGNWTECDAEPVGRGHETRSRVEVNGLSGGNQSCTEQTQHQMCVVNKGTPNVSRCAS